MSTVERVRVPVYATRQALSEAEALAIRCIEREVGLRVNRCQATRQAERDIQRLVEEVRRDGLPKRVEYAEIGSVHLPASLFDALRGSRGRGWTIGDLSALATLLHCFEIRDASLVERATFEEDEAGESVLVGKGRELKFVSRVNTSPVDSFPGSRVELDLDWLARVGWFDVTREGGRIEVRLGPKATALREGRPS